MLTIQDNYDMKVRLFKVEYPKSNFAKQIVLNEIDYKLPNFTNKESYFRNYLEKVRSIIKDEILNVWWSKGDTWHDDMLIININHKDNYYKVSHFS